MRAASVFFVVFVISFVRAAPLHTVEGIWSDSKYGGKIYLCVDDRDSVWATYSEAGVLWGRTSEDRTLSTGRWYEAGLSQTCDSGTWQAFVTQEEPDILQMAYFCANNPRSPVAIRNETRFADSANDRDCNVVKSEAVFEGSWGNKLLDVDLLVACRNGDAAFASINTEQERFVYVTGASYEDGRILTGRYYSEAANGVQRTGPYMFFPVSRTEAVQIFWTGDTINPNQLNDPTSHRVENGIQYRGSSTSRCHDNSFVVEDFGVGSVTMPILSLLLAAICFSLF